MILDKLPSNIRVETPSKNVQNRMKYKNINPNELDEEICNYEAGQTQKDFFKMEDFKIEIVDDREDDEIPSSHYAQS